MISCLSPGGPGGKQVRGAPRPRSFRPPQPGAAVPNLVRSFSQHLLGVSLSAHASAPCQEEKGKKKKNLRACILYWNVLTTAMLKHASASYLLTLYLREGINSTQYSSNMVAGWAAVCATKSIQLKTPNPTVSFMCR